MKRSGGYEVFVQDVGAAGIPVRQRRDRLVQQGVAGERRSDRPWASAGFRPSTLRACRARSRSGRGRCRATAWKRPTSFSAAAGDRAVAAPAHSRPATPRCKKPSRATDSRPYAMRSDGSLARATKRRANASAFINSDRRHQQAVLDHRKLGVDHDPEQAVAADRQPKQFGVLRSSSRSRPNHRPA